MDLRNIMFHEAQHAQGLPIHQPIKTPMQRQIDIWVKLGSVRQRGRPIVLETGNGYGFGVVFGRMREGRYP